MPEHDARKGILSTWIGSTCLLDEQEVRARGSARHPPPRRPVITMPRSTMSWPHVGGDFERRRTASTIAAYGSGRLRGSARRQRAPSSEPDTRCAPFTSIFALVAVGAALPIWILIAPPIGRRQQVEFLRMN